mmetsp:Transcript_115460/g.209939  ORF Transcript_115460/g.209939 Transcript_115460/m.209939 type:complete len:223 (-) Transcript_115460:294-962(-)
MIPRSVKILVLLLAVTAEAQATASACEDCAEAGASDQTELLQQRVQTHSSPAKTGQQAMDTLLETEEDDDVYGLQSKSASEIFPSINFEDPFKKAKEVQKKIEEQNKKQAEKAKEQQKKKKAKEEHALKRDHFVKDGTNCKKHQYTSEWSCALGTLLKRDKACSPAQPAKRLPYAEPKATSPMGFQCLIDALMDEECGNFLQIYDNGTVCGLGKNARKASLR